MSDTIWTPLRPDVSEPGGTPKWCDGTAFFYPTEPGKMLDGSLKAKSLRLIPYNQIIQIHNAITAESSETPREEWLATKPLTKKEIQDFKEKIEEWQHAFEADWEIPIGDEKYFHKNDVNELRRLATYPNTKYKQDVRSQFPLLHDICIDKVTKGMRVYIESVDNVVKGWEQYINTQIAPVNQSHRFWLWTQQPNMGWFRNTTVGIIGLDGKIKPPVGSNIDDVWTETPANNDGDRENWWLIQLVQDVHKPIDNLSTVKKALKGRQHWMEYTVSVDNVCVKTCDSEPPLSERTTQHMTVYSSCSDRTEEYDVLNATMAPCAGWMNAPGCWCLTDPGGCTTHSFYTDTYPEEDEDIEIGGDFFQTWEYYMDQL